jgi:hypothetical protein
LRERKKERDREVNEEEDTTTCCSTYFLFDEVVPESLLPVMPYDEIADLCRASLTIRVTLTVTNGICRLAMPYLSALRKCMMMGFNKK